MGFNSVYRALQEIFPDVDVRLLRAVAVEHSKDADAAVESVLLEIIPYLSERAIATSSSSGIGIVPNPSEGADTTARTDDDLLEVSNYLVEAENGFYDATCGDDANDELIPSDKSDEGSEKDGTHMSSHVTSIALMLENDVPDDHDVEVHGSSESDESNSLGKCERSAKVGSDESSHFTSVTLKHADGGANGSLNEYTRAYMDNFDGPACDFNSGVQDQSHEEHSYKDGDPLEVKNSVVQLAPSPVQSSTVIAPESSFQLVVVPDFLVSDVKKPALSDSIDAASKKDSSNVGMVDLDDHSTMNSMISRSGQSCSMDLLKDIIEDARSNKKTLFSAMESVIILMREVELQEKAAEEAKEAAARGDLDILTRVEGLKQMLQHAKEANEMHAGEVYGEKAILATEVRELQSRLFNLSDERDKALAIVDEMRQALEVRLEEAEKVKKAADQEKLEKEVAAREALAEQELIMEKIVQQSKILKVAEKNSELREFLMNRGRVVDMLQGEISVICQDVKLLKEKFDERLPLSNSLCSSQTSCLLASSSSSLKSMVPELADSSETPKETNLTLSVDDQSLSGEEKARDDQKELIDDGWELFDNRELLM